MVDDVPYVTWQSPSVAYRSLDDKAITGRPHRDSTRRQLDQISQRLPTTWTIANLCWVQVRRGDSAIRVATHFRGCCLAELQTDERGKAPAKPVKAMRPLGNIFHGWK